MLYPKHTLSSFLGACIRVQAYWPAGAGTFHSNLGDPGMPEAVIHSGGRVHE